MLLQIGVVILLAHKAFLQADSISKWTEQHKVEPAGCVSDYDFSIKDGIGVLVIREFKKDSLLHQDSATVVWNDPPCGDSLPTFHGHLSAFGYGNKASDIDKSMAAAWNRPFDLVLWFDDSYKLKDINIYGIRRTK